MGKGVTMELAVQQVVTTLWLRGERKEKWRSLLTLRRLDWQFGEGSTACLFWCHWTVLWDWDPRTSVQPSGLLTLFQGNHDVVSSLQEEAENELDGCCSSRVPAQG